MNLYLNVHGFGKLKQAPNLLMEKEKHKMKLQANGKFKVSL